MQSTTTESAKDLNKQLSYALLAAGTSDGVWCGDDEVSTSEHIKKKSQ